MKKEDAPVRLDRILALSAYGSRSEIRRMIAQGRVSLNGKTALSPDIKIRIGKDSVTVDGNTADLRLYHYWMINKPEGVLSATEDKTCQTVADLLPEHIRDLGLAPAGRLDKDSTGLVLMTNDGNLSHRILSPSSHLEKEYLVTFDGTLTDKDTEVFASGIETKGGARFRPAVLEIIRPKSPSLGRVILTEGKFHEIKRMAGYIGKPVRALHRVRIGPLKLDGKLAPGGCRPLTKEEESLLQNAF